MPESDTDFVFAAVGEKYGFVGAGIVLLLYALLISRTLRVLVMAKDLFGSLIAAGVAAMLMFQVFVNVGMTIGIMPITGVTLPLMSYGGSSVIATLLGVGLLQSIYVQARASAALKGRVLRTRHQCPPSTSHQTLSAAGLRRPARAGRPDRALRVRAGSPTPAPIRPVLGPFPYRKTGSN